MNRMTLLLLCLLIGCASRGPSLHVDPSGPTNPKPAVETIFSVLVDRAASSPDRYETTDDLVRVVRKLHESKDVTIEQLKAVDAKLGTARRKLTADDLNAIRGL